MHSAGGGIGDAASLRGPLRRCTRIGPERREYASFEVLVVRRQLTGGTEKGLSFSYSPVFSESGE